MSKNKKTRLTYDVLEVRKKTPLKISRAVSGNTETVWVKVWSEGIEGWGAACPFSTGHYTEGTEDITACLDAIGESIGDHSPVDRQRICGRLKQVISYHRHSAAMAALDTALYDWVGKRLDRPLWNLLGCDLSRIPPTSVTVGMEEPETAVKLAEGWLKGNRSAERLFPGQGGAFRILKLKLGGPEGIDSDKRRFDAVAEAAREVPLIVDANGGWGLSSALEMCDWLERRGVRLVEQPLPPGAVEDWQILHDNTSLDLVADESCFLSKDIVELKDYTDGLVIKMMKCGGLSEALRMIHAARACGLLVMLGCYSDTALSNSAMAQISSLVDYVDLDSHLNLINDPFQGAEIHNGRLMPAEAPGIGVRRRDS